MDYNKYKNDGWGLSKQALIEVSKVIASTNDSEYRIVEFGSGISTSFLVDLNKGLNIDLNITSFDNDPKYSYKGGGVNLIMTELVECSDVDYDRMFVVKEFHSVFMKPKTTPLSTRQKNTFYNIKDGNLSGVYDLMILDGPNGNGRNLAFLHMINHLVPGSHVLIDDTGYYDFIDKFKSIYNATEVFKSEGEDNFSIFKII